MDTELLVVLIITAVIVVALLIYKKGKVEIGDGAGVLISTFGLATSYKIFQLLVMKADLGAFKDFKVYLVLGAFASLWMAIQTVIRLFKK